MTNKRKRRTLQITTENPDQMIKPLEAMNLHCNAPLLKGDRKVWNILIENAWKEIANDQWHSVPTGALRFGSGNYRSRIQESLRRLMGAIVEIEKTDEKGKKNILRVPILGDNHLFEYGVLKYRFSPGFIDVIFNSERWAFVRKSIVFKMRSAYSISLYEWAESRFRRKTPNETVSISNLREILGVQDGKFLQWRDLKSKVFLPALDEVNCLADHKLLFEPVKNGKRYTHVKFIWGLKSGYALDDAHLTRTGAKEYLPKGTHQKFKDELIRAPNEDTYEKSKLI